MHDDDLLLDFWLEPIALKKEVAFRVTAAESPAVNEKLAAAGIKATEAIENVQEAVNYQVGTTEWQMVYVDRFYSVYRHGPPSFI